MLKKPDRKKIQKRKVARQMPSQISRLQMKKQQQI
jgi:hypothetical protein